MVLLNKIYVYLNKITKDIYFSPNLVKIFYNNLVKMLDKWGILCILDKSGYVCYGDLGI
jgi:hypothetical protein